MDATSPARVMFPGEPHLRDILLRAAVAGKKGLEIRILWSRSTENYVGGDDYALLHEFGYLSDLKTWQAFKGSLNERMYAHLTPRGRHLIDWAAGKQQNSMPEIRPVNLPAKARVS